MALAIDPNDALALFEISWAAFLDKELERAEQGGRDSVRFAKDNDIKGAKRAGQGDVVGAQRLMHLKVFSHFSTVALSANDPL